VLIGEYIIKKTGRPATQKEASRLASWWSRDEDPSGWRREGLEGKEHGDRCSARIKGKGAGIPPIRPDERRSKKKMLRIPRGLNP
jgi:hypothetical protein